MGAVVVGIVQAALWGSRKLCLWYRFGEQFQDDHRGSENELDRTEPLDGLSRLAVERQVVLISELLERPVRGKFDSTFTYYLLMK